MVNPPLESCIVAAVDRETCRDLIAQWDAIAFKDPGEGARHAEHCLDVVAKLDYPPELHARALTIYGSSRRAIGDLGGAEQAYRQALRIFDALLAEPDNNQVILDEADLQRRIAYLRAKQGRYPDALQCAGHALRIFHLANETHEKGRAFLARGSVLLMMDQSRSISALILALEHLDGEKSPEDFLAATSNLIYALTLFQDLDADWLEGALRRVTECRLSLRSRRRRVGTRYLKGHRRKTPADALMRYVQGRLLVLLERYEEARALLHTAREDLLELGMARELASASLELAECYLHLSGIHRWHRIEALCREVLTALASEPDTTDAIAAFKLLRCSLLERSAQEARDGLSSARRALGPAGTGSS